MIRNYYLMCWLQWKWSFIILCWSCMRWLLRCCFRCNLLRKGRLIWCIPENGCLLSGISGRIACELVDFNASLIAILSRKTNWLTYSGSKTIYFIDTMINHWCIFLPWRFLFFTFIWSGWGIWLWNRNLQIFSHCNLRILIVRKTSRCAWLWLLQDLSFCSSYGDLRLWLQTRLIANAKRSILMQTLLRRFSLSALQRALVLKTLHHLNFTIWHHQSRRWVIRTSSITMTAIKGAFLSSKRINTLLMCWTSRWCRCLLGCHFLTKKLIQLLQVINVLQTWRISLGHWIPNFSNVLLC